mgnify:CR=1 FL=1
MPAPGRKTDRKEEEPMKKILTTLCYMERDGKYLMLHRTKKENDINRDKYIGVGGHLEQGESPEDCIVREVREETGYTLTRFRLRGLITFVMDDMDEYSFLYTADGFTGKAVECREGVLEWVEKARVYKLPIWEGDRLMFALLDERKDVFSLKLCYESGVLIRAYVDGAEVLGAEPQAPAGG